MIKNHSISFAQYETARRAIAQKSLYLPTQFSIDAINYCLKELQLSDNYVCKIDSNNEYQLIKYTPSPNSKQVLATQERIQLARLKSFAESLPIVQPEENNNVIYKMLSVSKIVLGAYGNGPDNSWLQKIITIVNYEAPQIEEETATKTTNQPLPNPHLLTISRKEQEITRHVLFSPP